MADSDGQELEETSRGSIRHKALSHCRRDLNAYQAEVEDIRQQLEAALDEDYPKPMTMIALQGYLTDLDDMDARARRDIQSLIRRETEEGQLERDKAEKKLFRTGWTQAKALGTKLLYFKTASNLIQDLDEDIAEMERKQASHPTRDYAVPLSSINKQMTSLKDTLKGSDVLRGHILWAQTNQLNARL